MPKLMNIYVLDASVITAAFSQEEYADHARKLLSDKHSLLAPDLIYAELANVIWKRHTRGEINQNEAAQLLADIRNLPLRITLCGELAKDALELALRTSCSAYDCFYLALAAKTGSLMLTADKRLVNSLASTPLKKYIAWVGDRY